MWIGTKYIRRINTVIDLVEKKIKNFSDQIIAVSYAEDSSCAEEAIELLKKRIGEKKLMITRIGCVLGVHLGLSGVGILFMNKIPNLYIEE